MAIGGYAVSRWLQTGNYSILSGMRAWRQAQRASRKPAGKHWEYVVLLVDRNYQAAAIHRQSISLICSPRFDDPFGYVCTSETATAYYGGLSRL